MDLKRRERLDNIIKRSHNLTKKEKLDLLKRRYKETKDEKWKHQIDELKNTPDWDTT